MYSPIFFVIHAPPIKLTRRAISRPPLPALLPSTRVCVSAIVLLVDIPAASTMALHASMSQSDCWRQTVPPAIRQLNVSSILYTPFFCNDSVYWQSYRHIEGSPDQSIINTTETPTNVLPDDAEAFYSDLMEWGTQ